MLAVHRITFTLIILLLSIPTTYSLNNHHPDFTQNEYTTSISEGLAVSSVVLQVSATDSDGDSVSYAIQGDAHNYFTLGESSGMLLLERSLDREAVDSLDFEVIAFDDAVSPRTTTARIVIAIDDVNDNKPEFTASFPATITFSEATEPSMTLELARYAATDADTGTNAQIIYSIAGDPNMRFYIGPLNGSLYLLTKLDYEVEQEVNLLIVATDRGTPLPPLSRQKGVRIILIDVPDTPPEFVNTSTYSVSIPENTTVSTVIFTVQAMDKDAGGTNGFIFTIISQNVVGRFAITSGGAISVATSLDFETLASYTLVIFAQEVTAMNPMQQTATATVTVTITDVNDEPPVLPTSVVGMAAESIEIGHVVLHLTYTDPDTVENGYVFSILTAGAKFSVTNDGDIIVLSSLDYETVKIEQFMVRMCEALFPSLCSTANVQVTVTDENDNSPVFAQNIFTASIVEETPNPGFLTITATDADDGIFKIIRYSLTGTLAARFTVNMNTGVIDNTVAIDREINPTVTLTYIATDADPDNPRQTSVPLVITITDINDKIPVFLSIPTPCAFDVTESAAVDVFTYSVSDDDEAGTANEITVAYVNNSDFQIVGTHPLFTLKTSGNLDRETTDFYTLELNATDQGAPPLSSTIICTVTVTDVNDQTPVFSPLMYTVSLKESRAVSTIVCTGTPLDVSNCNSPVVTVTASDNDIGANARLTYEIELGNDEGLFFINSSTGEIFLQNSLDYETTTSYTLQVIAIDSAVSPLTGTGTVTITVRDVNDNTPVFGQSRYTFNIQEASAATSVLGTITASDGDATATNNVFTFAIIAGNTGTTFELIANGEVRVLVPPLFDMNPSFTLTLQVTDGGTDPMALFSTTIVEITVIDTNDNAPVLTGLPYDFLVTEGTHSGTPVGIASATDIDSMHTLTFTLVNPMNHPFTIDSSSGLITTTTSTIDREAMTPAEFAFSVKVTDSSFAPINEDTENVKVTIVDVNDNHPVFQSIPYTFGPIAENSAADTSVGTVQATDGDAGANAMVTFFIIGGNQFAYFKIDSSSGLITTTTTPIDFENIQSVTLTIEARDAGSPSRAADITAMVTISDVNDNPPIFLGTPYTATVAENIIIGTTVFSAILEDKDITTTTTTLTITAGNIAMAFRTDALNVILLNSLDRETLASYTLTIEANDSSATVTTQLAITVTDVNDNTPQISASTLTAQTFPEDRPLGTITTIVVTDDDMALTVNSKLYFELADTFGIFSLGQATGVLSQIASFDRETIGTYSLMITVRDGGLPVRSDTHTITVTITDVNEYPPTFMSNLFRDTIMEGQTVPYILMPNTEATDLDADTSTNGLVTHSIVSATSFRSSFGIDAQTGQLTLINQLDYEVVQEIVLNLMAIDNAATGKRSSTTNVIFTITDINDNSPIFLSSTHMISIFENTNVPATVGVFTARDIDSGVNAALTYSNDANMPGNFVFSSTSGVLTLNSNFDRDNLGALSNPFTFVVTATDGGATPLSDTSTITVQILDQNDNAPMFSMPSYSFTIAESTSSGVSVGTVLATESSVDLGANAVVEYRITHGGEGGFAINLTNGTITTTMGLDRETEDTYELTVVAYDTGTNSLSTFVAVTVTLTDQNDNRPMFSFASYHLNVTEGAPMKDVLSSVDIAAKDPDDGVNGQVTYFIPHLSFRANTVGLLATVQSILVLDFETTPHYEIEIEAIDGAASGKMTGTATLFITVLDVNDNPPDFGSTLTSYSFPESTSGGTALFKVTATDADSGINAEIKYTITAGNSAEKFKIQEDSGFVTTTTSPLDFEGPVQSYALTVTATDQGTPQMAENIVINIAITDSNDNEPVFASDPFTSIVPENDSTHTFNVPATDGDTSPEFKQIFYSIRTGSELGLFVINNMTGEISLTDTLDRELAGLEIQPNGDGLHRLIIQAQDTNRTEFTATTHVQISVTDLNDNYPFIDRECPFSLTVQEEVTPHAQLLTTIPVTDADFGAAGEYIYSIPVGNANGIFRINQTGTLEVFGTLLNRETQSFHLLQLEVRDLGTNPALTSTCMINVTVLDSNNNDPIFPDEPNTSIREDTSIDTLLLTYIASDMDIGTNADIVYSINSGNFGSKFSIGQSDGQLTVIGTLDFESLKFYALEIYGIDRGTPARTGTGMITINITDVNDNTPVLVENTATSIRENIPNNVPIYTAFATDADSGNNMMIEYIILNGNVGLVFEMDINTGIITILDSTPINREVRDEYILTLSARDTGTPPLEDILNLTITVLDFNDETPYFLHGNLVLDIIEDTIENNYTGQILITLTGNDSDIGTNAEFTFKIDGGNSGGSFALSLDGVLTRIISIDRETTDDFNLTLTIVDMGTPQLSSSVYAYIDITDSNDNTPIFSSNTYTFSTFEDATIAAVIGAVSATDEDEGVNKVIAYMIPDTSVPFSANSSTGVISVSSPLDREVQAQFSFTIEGYDMGVHPRTATTSITIDILDRNDNQPYFLQKSYEFTIPEGHPTNNSFDIVVATDSDIAPNNVLYYHMLSGYDTISVGLTTGDISVVRDLDRESTDFFVNASMLVSNTMTLPDPSTYNYTFSRAEVSIRLTDRNDNPPRFTLPWYRSGVLSNTEYESIVTAVVATDADLVNDTYFGGEIMFFPDPSEINTNLFRLDSTTGNIHVFGVLASEVGNYFDLHVIASDNRRLDPHFNSSTRVTLWVLTSDLQIVITIKQSKPEVEANINRITEILQNITQSYINIDQVIYNDANNEHTDIYFHAVDKDTLGIVSRSSVIRVVDENRISVDSLFRDITVYEVRPASSPVISLDPVLFGIAITLAVLVVICCCLLTLCIIYDQVRRKQIKHRQRVSLLKSYDASLDYNYSLSGQTYENPMWLHPYEQWEKEDEFTKGNPLFYESKEFIMDMFRESDDERSQETASFGSFGASQSKMRARAGISGMSKASTLTRMSDVDQDYNVELLAEVLGDDLPPSGDDPSEISNI